MNIKTFVWSTTFFAIGRHSTPAHFKPWTGIRNGARIFVFTRWYIRLGRIKP